MPTKEKEPEEFARFDDSRAALVFALNAHQVAVPTAYMNKAMAEVKWKPKRKNKSLKALHEEEERRISTRKRHDLARISTPPLRGLEPHHQAGIILFHFKRLDKEHQVILTGLLTTPHVPCSCRRPCCRGWSATEQWSKAVREMCDILQFKGDILKAPGKKGLSSQPGLRRAVVEGFFTKRECRLTDLAALAKVSGITAARHKEWIVTYLEQCEQEAWLSLDPIFDQAGITGNLG
jgi:hypothetical protein